MVSGARRFPETPGEQKKTGTFQSGTSRRLLLSSYGFGRGFAVRPELPVDVLPVDVLPEPELVEPVELPRGDPLPPSDGRV